MRGIVPVIEPRLGKDGLVSGRGDAIKGLNPDSDHPAGLKVDVVRVLETNSLLLLKELETIWPKGRLLQGVGTSGSSGS